MLNQDLHIHSVWSTGDTAVVPEQTIPFIAEIGHAKIRGMSDHFDYLTGSIFHRYEKEVRGFGFLLGTEVNGEEWVSEALTYPFDYYVYHCRDRKRDYAGADRLLTSGKPVIIAHPFALGTDIDKTAPECVIEINNRYIWRHRWRELLQPYAGIRRFVLSSDAHQPNWLNQTIARYAAGVMGIREEILFQAPRKTGQQPFSQHPQDRN